MDRRDKVGGMADGIVSRCNRKGCDGVCLGTGRRGPRRNRPSQGAM